MGGPKVTSFSGNGEAENDSILSLMPKGIPTAHVCLLSTKKGCAWLWYPFLPFPYIRRSEGLGQSAYHLSLSLALSIISNLHHRPQYMSRTDVMEIGIQQRDDVVGGDHEKWVCDSSVDHKGRVPLRSSTGVWKASLFIIGNSSSFTLHPLSPMFSRNFFIFYTKPSQRCSNKYSSHDRLASSYLLNEGYIWRITIYLLIAKVATVVVHKEVFLWDWTCHCC